MASQSTWHPYRRGTLLSGTPGWSLPISMVFADDGHRRSDTEQPEHVIHDVLTLSYGLFL